MYEEYYKKVEQILNSFPKKYQRNYYENKKDLIIKEEPIRKREFANYDNLKNEITLYKKNALPHELFHMAFRDRNKVGKKLLEDDDTLYGNGVAHEFELNGKIMIGGKAITEGFAEYLSRKCDGEKGHLIEYFFADLLISIYGEEIIKYALDNNPLGFYEDERFFDITLFCNTLDLFQSFSDGVKIVNDCKENLKKVLSSGNDMEKLDISKIISEIRNGLKQSIVELFRLIISEYENCNNPKISKEDFESKLLSFLKKEDYKMYLIMDDNELSIEKEIKNMVKNISNDYTK